MELSELGIVFATEGADAAIAKMDAFRDASLEVIQTDEERVKAAGKVATATSNLADQINRSILSYAGSKSLVYEYTAAQLGVNDALGAQIGYLRELEQHAQLANDTARETTKAYREEQGALLDLARDIEYLNKVKAKESADAEAARQKELASRDAYYAKVVAEAKAAEQAITDARHKAIVDQQNATDKAAAMYAKEEQERVKAADAAAKQIMAVQKKAADDATKIAEQKAMSEISWAMKSRDEQIRIKEQIAAYKAAGVSDSTVANQFGPAAVSGVVKEVENLAEKWDKVSLNTSRARSEMVVLAHEAVQGRFSRIPASLMVFAEYSDITALALSGVGLAIMGIVAAAVLMSIAMIKGMNEQKAMNDALILTGNYAGQTSDSLTEMAHAATHAGGSISEAKKIVTELAGSGKFTGEQIQSITSATVEMEHAVGGGEKTVGMLVKQFESLAVQGYEHSKYSDAVSKATLKLDDQYHFLTTSVLAQIQALEAEGRIKEASILATNTFADVTKHRAEEIIGNLGTIEKGWRWVKDAIGEATDAVGNWGKRSTAADAVKNAEAELASLNKLTGFGTDGAKEKATLKLAEAQKELIRVNDRAQEQSEKAQSTSKANHALADIETEKIQLRADKMGQLATAMEAYHNRLQALRDNGGTADNTAALKDEAILEHELGLQNKYREKKVAAIKENSMITLNEYVKEQNEEFNAYAKHIDKMALLQQRDFTLASQTEADKFATMRSNAQQENELGFGRVTNYIAHYEALQDAANTANKNQQALYDEELRMGVTRTMNIINAENEAVVATQRGEEERLAKISKALADQSALESKIRDLKTASSEKAANEGLKAEADAYKALDIDMNKVINTLSAKLAKEQKHLDMLLLTKDKQAELSAQQDEALSSRLKAMEASLELEKDSADGDSTKLKFYNEQISKLKTIIELKTKSVKVEEQTAVAQRELDRVKAVEGAWKKSWEATNKVAEDVFVTWAEGGQDMAKKIGDMLKKALLEAIYTATIKPIVLQLFMSVMGNGGSAGQVVLNSMTGGSNGVGNMINGASNLNTLYGAGSQFLYGGTAGASNASLLYANGTQAVGGDGIGALIQGNGGWAGVSTSGGQATSEAAMDAWYSSEAVPAGTAVTEGAAGGSAAAGGISAASFSFLPLLFAAYGASRDAFSVASTGDSNSQYDSTGKLINRSNQVFGGDKPISIVAVKDGVALANPAKPSDYRGFDPTGVPDFMTQDRWNADNAAGDLQFNNINKSANTFTETMNKLYLSAAKGLGVGAVSTNFTFGTNNTRNGEGGGARLGVSAGDRQFDSGDITRSDADMKLAANRAILTALEGSELPKWMKGVFDGVDASTLDQAGIDAAIKKATDLKDAYNALALIPGINLDTINYELVDSLKEDAKALATVNIAASRFGYTMLDVSAQGGAAASALVAAFGDLATFQSQTSEYFQNYFTKAEQSEATYASIQSDLHKVGIDYTLDQIRSANRSDIRAVVDQAHNNIGTTQGDAQFAAAIKAANALIPLTNSLDAVTTSSNAAAAAVGGSSGGGGGGGTSTLVNALQGLIDAIVEEVKRIRQLTAEQSPDSFAVAQGRFAIATAQARAGDQNALGTLPQLSQSMLTLAETNAHTLQELQLFRIATAQSLQDTATGVAGANGLNIPSFDVGTNMIPQDMIALVHKGEAVVPAAYNPANGYSGGGSFDASGIVFELRLMREENKTMRADIKRMKEIWVSVTPKGTAIQSETVTLP